MGQQRNQPQQLRRALIIQAQALLRIRIRNRISPIWNQSQTGPRAVSELPSLAVNATRESRSLVADEGIAVWREMLSFPLPILEQAASALDVALPPSEGLSSSDRRRLIAIRLQASRSRTELLATLRYLNDSSSKTRLYSHSSSFTDDLVDSARPLPSLLSQTWPEVAELLAPTRLSEDMLKEAAAAAGSMGLPGSWKELSLTEQVHAIQHVLTSQRLAHRARDLASAWGEADRDDGSSALPSGRRHLRPSSDLLAVDTRRAAPPPPSPRSVTHPPVAESGASGGLPSGAPAPLAPTPRSIADSLRERISERARAGGSTILGVAIPSRVADSDEFARLLATSSTEAARSCSLRR